MATCNWYAVFSHTGSEICNIQKALGVNPVEIWTSNSNYSGRLPAVFGDKYEIEAKMLQVPEHSIITLNGYRKLISAHTLSVLKRRNVKVINIHPAPVCLHGYKDLRGIDPHSRYYSGYVKGTYTLLGVTLHEVDEGVDTGRVLYMLAKIAKPGMNYDTFVQTLHDMGTEAWVTYLPELLNMEG